MEGFFAETEVVEASLHVPYSTKCGKCQLYKTCENPKIQLNSTGNKKILLVGEAPGQTEDELGKFFVGKSGEFLWTELHKLGIKRKDVWITNSIICKPSKNRKPTAAEIDHCRPNVWNAIRQKNPLVIIPFGECAIDSVIRPMWKEALGPVSSWVGWTIPDQTINAWICPIFHPSYLLRQQRGEFGRDAIKKYGEEGHPVLNRLFRQYLFNAAKLARKGTRPHNPVPNYKKQVKCLYGRDGARAIRDLVNSSNKAIAFDYETNRLKPYASNAKIVCCSMSNGDTTIAYVWNKYTKEETINFLKSKHPKIASNLKFEDKWSYHLNGVRPRMWIWDTMLAAHWMDNRGKISSIKFQSYVHLGVPKYDKHIHSYLASSDQDGLNKIDEVDQESLLVYCGLDSLLEYKIAEIQMKQVNHPNLKFMG